ncbi:hypothetical protein BDQ17DRAFT_1433507 [Cyathus striatus]|nr:hypothetical protein BDQ17DRAFT_1433507 [Cyathus striatus]
MPHLVIFDETGGLITGVDMCNYMETFAEKYINDKTKIHFEKEVLNIHRDEQGVEYKAQGCEYRECGGIEVCEICLVIFSLCETGRYVTDERLNRDAVHHIIPPTLTQETAECARFRGIVLHSLQFGLKWKKIIESTRLKNPNGSDAEVIGVEVCAGGCKVSNIFHTTNVFLASTKPLPDWVWKSWYVPPNPMTDYDSHRSLLGVFAGHIDLHTKVLGFYAGQQPTLILHRTTRVQHSGGTIVPYPLVKEQRQNLMYDSHSQSE